MEAEEIILELEEYFQPLLDFLGHADDQKMEITFRVPFGSGGPPEYFYRLCSVLKERFADFEPEGMQEWEAEQSEENVRAADEKIKEIVVDVQREIFTRFKSQYGTERDAYWHKGITDKSIKTRAYEKSLDDDDDTRLPLENYLDVIDYKKIVENKNNWPVFKELFDIAEPGEKGLAKNLKWMERINELRRISAHPTERRHYKVEDFEYIDFIHQNLKERVQVVASRGDGGQLKIETDA